MKQQNVELIERWIKSKNSQPTPEEENQLSSRSVERPPVLDEVEQLVKNTQMHLQQLRQEAEVHAQRLQEFQKELDACSTSTENADIDSDEGTSIDHTMQIEPVHKEVKTKLPQPQDREEDEKKDDGTEKLLNTDTVRSNKAKAQPEEKMDAKRVDEEKDTDVVQQVNKSKEKEQLISDKQARLATERLMALKADIAKTLEGLQSVKTRSIELPDSGRKVQYHIQQVAPSDEQNRSKITVDRPCRAKPQAEGIAADVDRNRYSKNEVQKVQNLDNLDKVPIDSNTKKQNTKTKLHKAPSAENVNKETVEKIRHSKTKLDEIQRLENAAKVSEAEPKERHSKTKCYKSHTAEDVVKASDKEKCSRTDMQEIVHSHARRSKRKYVSEIPPTPACSCSSLMNQEEIPRSLPPTDQRQPSKKMSERHPTKFKGIQQVVMAHKTSQTTSNTSVIHIKEEVRSTIQQVHNTKQLTVQQLPSLNIRRTLSVQKVPSVQIPPPGADAYVSPHQNIAFWGMSQDGAVLEVQKYGSSANINNSNVDKVKEERQEVLTLEEPILPQWKDDFTETEMYTWFCEACHSVSAQNMNVPENQYLTQCKECLRHFPTTELFQQHCIECQVVKKETRLDQCVKCLRSVPSTEIINNHCPKCQSVENVQFYQDTSKTSSKKQNNLQVCHIEKVDLPEKEPEDKKDISNNQLQTNTFSYALQRKESEHDADRRKELQPAHISRSKSVKPVPEYSRNDYHIKGDILSSLGEEEVIKELESYMTKEFPNVGNDFLDITGQLSDVSSLEEYLHSKGQDTQHNLSDTELGELILNSLSARLQQQQQQQQTAKPCELVGSVNKVLHEQVPVTMVFRAETSEGRNRSVKKSPHSQRAKSAPSRHSDNENSSASSNRESPAEQHHIPGTNVYTHSKYHQHCFDSVIYPVHPAKIDYPVYKNKKTMARKSPRPKKQSADNVKQIERSKTPEDPKRSQGQRHEQDIVSKAEEEESKNKLRPTGDTDNDADYETDSVQTSVEEYGKYGKMTEESYEDDWEEESQHSATEGVKPQAETATQTDTIALGTKERSREKRSDRATSPVDALRRAMVTVDVQTSEMMISPPTSESLPPSEATLPAAAVLVDKLQNACKCSPDIEATEQALRVVIGEKQMSSLGEKLEIACNCPTHPQDAPRVRLVDKQTSTENNSNVVDTPTSPICPSGDELKVVCISPSGCGILHKTVANAAKGVQKMTVDKATSTTDNTRVQGGKKVRLVHLPTSNESEDSMKQTSESVQTSQQFHQAACTLPTCPAHLRQSKSHQGCPCTSSTDDDCNKISGPCSRSSDDEMTSSTIVTSQTHSEPVTSRGSTDSGVLYSCYCGQGTVSQGEVLFDMQPSEGEVLVADFNTSAEETLSTEATSEKVLAVVNLRDGEHRMQSNDDDDQSDGEISEGQVFLH